MAGKITTILAKREADTYCIQGLHKEALHLYRNLLATSPNIDPSFKTGIEKQIQKISSAMESDDLEEANRMTAADIRRVKQGWGDQATESDMLICAQAFYQMGHYKEALSEMVQMLRNSCANDRISNLFADCLVVVNPPEEVANAFDSICAETLISGRARLDFELITMEEMVSLNAPTHAKALLESRKGEGEIGDNTSRRLSEISDKIIRSIQAQSDINRTGTAAETRQSGAVEDDTREISPPQNEFSKKGKIKSFFRWPFSRKERL